MRRGSSIGLSGVWVLLTVWIALAAQPGSADVGVPTSPNQLVLSFTYEHEMLADPDPTPLMQIYGDGRVQIHFPVYMQRAGDYEVQITPPELHQLLRSWANTGVLDFDSQAVKEARRQEVERRARRGELFHISDATHLVIDVHLDWYRPGAGPQINNFQKNIRWSNVQQEAEQFPGLPALQNLAAAEEQLRSILQRDDLRKVN